MQKHPLNLTVLILIWLLVFSSSPAQELPTLTENGSLRSLINGTIDHEGIYTVIPRHTQSIFFWPVSYGSSGQLVLRLIDQEFASASIYSSTTWYGFDDVQSEARINTEDASSDIFLSDERYYWIEIETSNSEETFQFEVSGETEFRNIPTQFSGRFLPSGTVALTWTTGNNLNTAGFNLERKIPGYDSEWTVIDSYERNNELICPDYKTCVYEFFYTDQVPKDFSDYFYRLIEFDNEDNPIKDYATRFQSEQENSVLLPPYPNPGNPTTRISYVLSKDAKVNLTVVDVSGRSIIQLINSRQTRGSYQTFWSGKNMNSQNVGSGVYFIVLNVDQEIQTKRFVLIQ